MSYFLLFSGFKFDSVDANGLKKLASKFFQNGVCSFLKSLKYSENIEIYVSIKSCGHFFFY